MELPVLKGSSVLTHSRFECFKACPRMHYLRYELGVRRDDVDRKLRIGQNVHLGLELLDKGISLEDVCEQIRSNYAEIPPWVDDKADWEEECEICIRLLCGHHWRYEADTLECVASELQFEIPILNPATEYASTIWMLAGKIDRIVKLPDGRLAVQEYKTCQEDLSQDSDYWRRLRIDQQISLYVLAARALDYAIDTVLYDVIRKPTLQRYRTTPLENRKYTKDGRLYANQRERDETPEEYGDRITQDMGKRPDFYFARMEIPRLDQDLEEFRWELWQQQQAIRESQKSGRWFRNTSRCFKPYTCEFVDICLNAVDPTNGLPNGFVRSETIHPELE